MAAGANDLEVAFNEFFTQALPGRAALWVAPDAVHTGAFALYPGEYQERVIGVLPVDDRP